MHVLEHPGGETPVLCVHGFCQSSAYWAPTLNRLDVRGFADPLERFPEDIEGNRHQGGGSLRRSRRGCAGDRRRAWAVLGHV